MYNIKLYKYIAALRRARGVGFVDPSPRCREQEEMMRRNPVCALRERGRRVIREMFFPDKN